MRDNLTSAKTNTYDLQRLPILGLETELFNQTNHGHAP